MKKLLITIIALVATVSLHAESEIVSFHLTSDTGLPDNNIQRLWQDSLGYIYMFGRYSTFRYDGYDFYALTEKEATGLNVRKIQRGDLPDSEFTDDQGNPVKLLANGDLRYTDKKSGKVYTFNVMNPRLFQLTQRIKCTVITDRRGLIWVSTNGGGLRIYNPKTDELQTIDRNDPRHLIPNDHIISMMEDRDGNIWLSGEYHGVTCLKVRQRDYEVIDINITGAEKGSEVRMLTRLTNARILIADMDGKVSMSTDELQTISPLKTDGHNYISACLDNDDRLWLGSRSNGIFVDGKSYGSDRVDCIVKDRKGRMWTCGLKSTLKQVTVGKNGYHEKIFLQDMEGLEPRVLLVDHRGDIWLGTRQGLFVFNPDSLISNPKRYHKVTSHRVMCLYESSEQYIWVGTAGQGAFYAPGKNHRATQFTQVSTHNGLASNIVQSISETPEKHLCIGTEDGISFIDPFKHTVNNLFFTDNRLRNILTERSVVSLSNGRMAFGTMDGIVVTNRKIWNQEREREHQVYITGIEVNGVPVTGALTDACTFTHDQNSLTFSFSSLNYGQQRQTIYQYRLEGYDREWSNFSLQHQAVYKNLKPGRYTLHVRGTTVAGQSSDKETILTVNILPPWWLTWWAYLLYIVVATIMALAVYRQIRNMARLRQCIAVEKELTDYKLKFFTNISHEFRTPLTLIQGSMDRLRQIPDATAQARQPISAMQRNVDRLMRLVNQLLEFRRMQNNKLSLSLEETDLISFVHNICQGFHDTAEQRRISLTFTPSVKELTTFIDRGFIDKAVYNLLSNAFKYTPKGGSVIVRVKSDDAIKIIVEDTGVGVPEEMRDKMFDRFARGQLRSDSLGIGLDLTAELMRTHHGSITYEPREGGGSVFIITLPTDRSVYNDDDFLKIDNQLDATAAVERQGFTEQIREVQMDAMNEHRILVVEDDADLAVYMRQELGRYFQVEVANSGEEALSLPLYSFSLIISDIMMPGIDGYELLRRLRRDEQSRHIPAILLTALSAPDKLEKGFSAGADAYITKPFSMPLLLLQVRNLLQRADDQRRSVEKRKDAEHQEDAHTLNRKAVAAAKVIIDERDRRLIDQLAGWVDSHLADPELSVDKFAADMDYGRTKFYGKLKQLTGFTPNEYIKERRLQRAYELLADEHVTVSEVAYQVGLGTPQYLSTIFKKRFGLTPTQYQKGESAKA